MQDLTTAHSVPVHMRAVCPAARHANEALRRAHTATARAAQAGTLRPVPAYTDRQPVLRLTPAGSTR